MQKDLLESLIELLSDSEKRYISKRLIVRGDKNNFSSIFNAATAKKESQKMATMQAQNPNSYYVTRNLLKEKITKLLRTYHSATSQEQVLKGICIDVEILYHKGAYSHCLNLIDGALEICEKGEWFELELYLLSCKEKVLVELSGDVLQNESSTNIKQTKKVLSKLENLQYHKQFMNKILLVIKKTGIPRNSAEFTKLRNLVYRYKHSGTKKATSYRAQIAISLAYIYYYYALQDYHQFYHYTQKHLRTVESFQKQSNIPMPGQISTTLQNLLTCELQLKKYDKLHKSLHKIRTIKFSSKKNKATVFSHSYTIETHLYASLGSFDKIQKLIPILTEGLENYKDLMTQHQKNSLYYNIAYLFFGSAQYKDALYWCNKILNNSELNVREDIYCFARILNLAIHYELGNNEVLEYLALSTFRYLYKKKRLFEMENAILTFIKYQMKYYRSPQKNTNALPQLLANVRKQTNNKIEQSALESFDFISWLESKIQNRPFAETVEKNFKKKSEK